MAIDNWTEPIAVRAAVGPPIARTRHTERCVSLRLPTPLHAHSFADSIRLYDHGLAPLATALTVRMHELSQWLHKVLLLIRAVPPGGHLHTAPMTFYSSSGTFRGCLQKSRSLTCESRPAFRCPKGSK